MKWNATLREKAFLKVLPIQMLKRRVRDSCGKCASRETSAEGGPLLGELSACSEKERSLSHVHAENSTN
ncbi:hypothetical protein [Peribacillus muralis]|uniref:hypothetical protein n=1 Tax=Peribacillus muralis TaxID=264697 RepID=UPI00366CD5C8